MISETRGEEIDIYSASAGAFSALFQTEIVFWYLLSHIKLVVKKMISNVSRTAARRLSSHAIAKPATPAVSGVTTLANGVRVSADVSVSSCLFFF